MAMSSKTKSAGGVHNKYTPST